MTSSFFGAMFLFLTLFLLSLFICFILFFSTFEFCLICLGVGGFILSSFFTSFTIFGSSFIISGSSFISSLIISSLTGSVSFWSICSSNKLSFSIFFSSTLFSIGGNFFFGLGIFT
jgi:hypothetical protein